MLWLGAILVVLVSTIGWLLVRPNLLEGTPHRQAATRARRRAGFLLNGALDAFRRGAGVARAYRPSRVGRPAPAGFPRRDALRRSSGQARWERRPRVVALIELVLFIVLLSTLFAGALAAVAMRLGHFGA